TFSETVTFPFPKKTVRVELNTWTRSRKMVKKFEYFVNPGDKFISKEKKRTYPLYKVVDSGAPGNKVDLIILPDGYTKEEMEKFRRDCQKFAGFLFSASPFKENKDKFNITGIEIPSDESGVDIPGDTVWKNTPLGLSFYTFDSERYMMTPDNRAIHDAVSNVPCDQIYILGNTTKYGGGAIYNHYSVCASDNKYSDYIFVHEFGHGFAGLADEYYTSDVAYQNFYPLDVEPADPNVTTLVDFDKKWKSMVGKDTPIPTPVEEKYMKSIGAFEGGGYVAKGVYRPSYDCTMKSISVDNFCGVCKKAIMDMIKYYTE
ncbi:MAG TPA: M64 family metallopeptidase, partial [Ignavibacteriales bacterium]|nr:M64 family metallopeptidase [Ignavibacteriales bacterium]